MVKEILVKIIQGKETSFLSFKGVLSEEVLEKVFVHDSPAPHAFSPDKPEERPPWEGHVEYLINQEKDAQGIIDKIGKRLNEYNSKVPEENKYNLISVKENKEQ